jgi:3-dehydroquinate synthetase
MIRIPATIVAQIDAAAGTGKRAAFVRAAIEKALKK